MKKEASIFLSVCFLFSLAAYAIEGDQEGRDKKESPTSSLVSHPSDLYTEADRAWENLRKELKGIIEAQDVDSPDQSRTASSGASPGCLSPNTSADITLEKHIARLLPEGCCIGSGVTFSSTTSSLEGSPSPQFSGDSLSEDYRQKKETPKKD